MGGKSGNPAGFRRRLAYAITLWQLKYDRKLKQDELAERVGKLRGEPVSQSTMSDWYRKIVPKVEDVEHLASVLECDPGWLAFGEASEAPGPPDPQLGAHRPVPRRKKP